LFFYYRSYGPKSFSRYWICGNGQSYPQSYNSIPTTTPNENNSPCLAQRLVNLCRNSSVSRSESQDFDENEDVFNLDREGDDHLRQFECPDTLKDMLIIVHDHQGRRNEAISTIGQIYKSQYSTPVTSKVSSSDYNMFCDPLPKTVSTTGPMPVPCKASSSDYNIFCDPVPTPFHDPEDSERQGSLSNFEYLFGSDSDSDSVAKTSE
jgi:hypothetical protein